MAIFEWPCPSCGQAQKSRDQAQVGQPCAACAEQKAHAPDAEAERTEAANGSKKAARK